MTRPDLNLLVTLDVLLCEGSVARAARRLKLSPSAMSRALARLREATGDPLLVRAGRGLVPTPRALELSSRIGPLVENAEAMLRPAEALDLGKLTRTFTLRNREGFVENFGAALIARVARQAPGVRLHFVQKLDRESSPLRDGSVDLETGVVSDRTGPELRAQALFHDRFVAVARPDHPLGTGEISARRYAQARHIQVSRRGNDAGPIDEALATLGLKRDIAVSVGSFSEALALARATDLVASVPERYTGTLRENLMSLPLPAALPTMTISLLWHPRLDADPAHRWLRGCVREVCGVSGEAPAASSVRPSSGTT
ncbi:LysR family transcriptional regulator [Ensifer sp. MJa1]|uniref:LysR family transcriptional regulator n=1 Tax=Ensifer sp. MJa1 TaxID=2919888 RepID=UPI0030081ABB